MSLIKVCTKVDEVARTEQSPATFTSAWEKKNKSTESENGMGSSDQLELKGQKSLITGPQNMTKDEWAEKYRFVLTLLRQPEGILERKSLDKLQTRLRRQLGVSIRKRTFLSASSLCGGDSERSAAHMVTSKLEHLDMMCVTLERQIDVLNNVHRVLPSNHESFYSGEPDSLDGTPSSGELMEDEDPDGHPPRSPRFTIPAADMDPLALLHSEQTAHRETRLELNQLKKRLEILRDEFDSGEGMSETTSLLFNNFEDSPEPSTVELQSNGKDGVKSFLALSRDLPKLENSITEITKLHTMLMQLERVRDELTLQNQTLKSKLGSLSTRLSDNVTNKLDQINNNCPMVLVQPDNPNVNALDEMKLRRKATYKVSHPRDERGLVEEISQLRSFIKEVQSKEADAVRLAGTSGSEVKVLRNELRSEREARKEADKGLRILESQLDECEQRLKATEQCFLTRDEEHRVLKLDLDTLKEENRRLRDELNRLHHHMEKEQCRGVERFSHFEREINCILEENRVLREDANKERILRKRYYNLVEELKGKIRVYCRIRPVTRTGKMSPSTVDHSVAKSCDPYTITVETIKGHKEFQFDRVFLAEDSQEQVFADTRALLQSAFDGFNVCCVSYGQTGSGKTYTILGEEGQPGIAPRTFTEVFALASEMSQCYDTKISFYVLELYNDRLIDLLNPPASTNTIDSPDSNKLEIRRDRTGTVWVSGARVLVAENSGALEKNFRHAVGARHMATTKMNDRSSRSHLIIGIIVETTSKTNGTLLRGKISLLDLAGSERTGKSGVSAETLREANAINKSLSALGDVINALNTEQNFVPYRNNKLTLLMQDSIGGNAKTLMFVNISPLASNLDETLVSLTYASRVKQVTNGPTRNTDSKEIARLRCVISRLKRGEVCLDEDML